MAGKITQFSSYRMHSVTSMCSEDTVNKFPHSWWYCKVLLCTSLSSFTTLDLLQVVFPAKLLSVTGLQNYLEGCVKQEMQQKAQYQIQWGWIILSTLKMAYLQNINQVLVLNFKYIRRLLLLGYFFNTLYLDISIRLSIYSSILHWAQWALYSLLIQNTC